MSSVEGKTALEKGVPMTWQELAIGIAALVLIELYVDMKAGYLARGMVREAVHVQAF